nr:aminoacyl-tRNA hydrolase [Motiliproteus sediminis]
MIVGLGNPGQQYDQTRHNAGADFVLQLAKELHCTLQAEKRFSGLYGKARLGNHDVHLLIPSTFMNLSGQAVQPLASYFKIPVESILVAHDELDIDPGTARLKRGGGHGGHNGLRDIIARFGGSNGFLRLRLGIGHPGNARQVAGYVLQKAPQNEREQLQACIDESLRTLPLLLNEGLQKAMTRLHSFKA